MDFSRSLSSVTANLSINSLADDPVVSFVTIDRYLGVMHSFSAKNDTSRVSFFYKGLAMGFAVATFYIIMCCGFYLTMRAIVFGLYS